MSVDWHIESVVDPGFFLSFGNDEVLGLFKQKDELVVEDVLYALLDRAVFHDLVQLLLNLDLFTHFDGMVDFLGEFLELLYLFGAWELVLPQQCALANVFHQDFSYFLVSQQHVLLNQEISLESLIDRVALWVVVFIQLESLLGGLENE